MPTRPRSNSLRGSRKSSGRYTQRGRWDKLAIRDERLDELEAGLERRDRHTLFRTTLLTLVPVAAAGAFLWITVREINDSQNELKAVKTELAETKRALATEQAELRRTRRELRRAKAELRRSADFLQYKHDVDLGVAKRLASESPALARVFLEVQLLHDASWSLANTRARGFTSPGFAGYVLQRGRLASAGEPEEALRKLPRVAGAPRSGDVILYEDGFALFYFTEGPGREFVIGMTPVGVIAMRPSFGRDRLGILRPLYPHR